MYALRIETTIPEDRRLIVDLPADAPVGAAEVIVLSTAEEPKGSSAAVLRYLRARRSSPTHRRTAAELERQIREERAAWE